jgi:hypothetical protein
MMLVPRWVYDQSRISGAGAICWEDREMYVIAFDVLLIVQKQLSISDLNFLGNFESTQRERVGNDTTM